MRTEKLSRIHYSLVLQLFQHLLHVLYNFTFNELHHNFINYNSLIILIIGVCVYDKFHLPRQDGFFSHLPSAKHDIFSIGLPDGKANPA